MRLRPGPIDTPMIKQVQPDAERTIWMNKMPQHRYGAPSDIASAAMFLLDDQKSGFITGQTICVDGGFTIAGVMRSAPPTQ